MLSYGEDVTIKNAHLDMSSKVNNRIDYDIQDGVLSTEYICIGVSNDIVIGGIR
mgnify:CR=1 FL=1